MVKQFLMKRISSFVADAVSDDNMDPQRPVVIAEDVRQRFFAHLCNESAASEHLNTYPPVGAYVSNAVA